jgi:hypothetical protein
MQFKAKSSSQNMSGDFAKVDPWYLPRRIRRIHKRDFIRYGIFAHIRLPLQTPIPPEILEHIFGKDHEQLGSKAELKLLLHLHEFINTHEGKIAICSDCEEHLSEHF